VVMGSPNSRWATVAVVALAGLVAGWFFFGRDRTPPGIGASGRPSVAVMYFESMSGDEEIRWLSKGLPNMLVTDLAQTPGLDVVSSQRIHEILKRIGHDDLDSIDKSVVAEVARKAGAGAVVVGSIFKSGDEIRIDVQVEDVASGRVLSADSVRGYDVFPLVDELTARIRTSLHIGDQPSARPIAEVTTPSLEAFQLYTEGYDTLLNVRYGHARTLLEEAVKIDPSFAMAHIALSFLAERRGDMAGSRDYVNKAFENLDRLPERQQLMVRARYAETTEDVPEKSVELYETLIARYPDEELAYMNLSFLYHDLGRPEDAVAAVERGVKAVPQSGPLYNAYGYQLLDVGRYPEAIRALETYARLNPEEPNPHDSLAEAFLITGQPEKALENYARSREVDPSFLASHVGSAFAFAVLGRYDEFFDDVAKLQEFSDQIGWPPAAYHFMKSFGLSRVGRYQDAAAELKEGLDVAGRAEDAGRQGALELLSALYALEQRNYRETLESVGRAEALLPHVESDWVGPLTVAGSLLAGTAEARSGNLEAARDRLDSQRDVMDSESQSEQWWRAALEGEVALAAADLAAAEVAFLAGEPEIKMTFSLGTSIIGTAMANSLPFHDGLARVRKAQGDLDGAIEIYRDLLTPDIGSKWVAWLEPRYVLRLARLFDETGDKEGARAEYERFLELWKDADEGLPEFKEARKYLGT
ncbi:MAG: tetratricopeptide repeat protein, partial [Vicinamibacteria bacterium]